MRKINFLWQQISLLCKISNKPHATSRLKVSWYRRDPSILVLQTRNSMRWPNYVLWNKCLSSLEVGRSICAVETRPSKLSLKPKSLAVCVRQLPPRPLRQRAGQVTKCAIEKQTPKRRKCLTRGYFRWSRTFYAVVCTQGRSILQPRKAFRDSTPSLLRSSRGVDEASMSMLIHVLYLLASNGSIKVHIHHPLLEP